jgi:arsenate reductase
MASSKPKVLFLCTGNSARSQMAEAYLRHLAGDQYDAYSAGLDPKGINPYTAAVLDEAGILLDGQYSKDVGEYLGRINFDYLITVCGHADESCPRTLLDVDRRIHWDLEDPAAFVGSDEETAARFRQVRDQIRHHVQEWIADPEKATG